MKKIIKVLEENGNYEYQYDDDIKNFNISIEGDKITIHLGGFRLAIIDSNDDYEVKKDDCNIYMTFNGENK